MWIAYGHVITNCFDSFPDAVNGSLSCIIDPSLPYQSTRKYAPLNILQKEFPTLAWSIYCPHASGKVYLYPSLTVQIIHFLNIVPSLISPLSTLLS